MFITKQSPHLQLLSSRLQLYRAHSLCTRSSGFCRFHQILNKKQCSRQLQCEVPCGVGNVINSSLFINSSLSSLSSTSHAGPFPPRGTPRGSSRVGVGGGEGVRGHFIHPAINGTTLKGLRTTKQVSSERVIVSLFPNSNEHLKNYHFEDSVLLVEKVNKKSFQWASDKP